MKTALTLAAAAAALTLAAAGFPDATPKTDPDFPKQADIWINGGTPAETNLGKNKVADSFSGTVLYKLEKQPESGEFSATYGFEAPEAGEYEFFAAIITQKRPHASPVDFRFDQDDWREVPNNPSGSPAWGVSNAVSWNPLGAVKLAAGKHTLSFRFSKRAGLGHWSFMCDGIAGFKKGGWKKSRVSGFTPPAKLIPGEAVTASYHQEGASFPARLLLTFAGDPVVSAGIMSRAGENSVKLTLPPALPPGSYQLKLVPFDESEQVLAKAELRNERPAAKLAPSPARLKSVALDGVDYSLAFEDGKTAPVLAMAFYDGTLYEAARLDAVSGTLPGSLTGLAKGRKIELRFLPLPAAPGNTLNRTLALTGKPGPLPKPVNYGTFTDRDGAAHTWFMNHDFEYIFDGERYFPVGGMWCSDTLISRDASPAAVERNLAKDLATIRAIKGGGLDDVYLNLSTSAPVWVRQAFIDMLEQEGIHYGYQLNAGGGDAIPSFFITRDKENAPGNYRGLARGTYAAGKVTARFPVEQKLAGLLVFDPARPQDGAKFVAFGDAVGKDTRNGIIDLETVQDFGKLREIRFPVELKTAEGGEVILVPLLEAKMHHSNLWNKEKFEAVKKRVSWIGGMEWGKNFRFIVDPIYNETMMTNGSENLRQYTPEINRVFADYLKKRYGTPGALAKEWGVSPESFEQAAQLIPLQAGDKLFWLDPETGAALPGGNPGESVGWIDYQEMIRQSYCALTDEFAAYLKSLVNVPVVYKVVGVIGETMNISRRYLGYDGVGFECYLNQGIPGQAHGGAARAIAEASDHTMWKVGTEVGHSAAVGNDGTKFFTDEKELRTMAENLARLGVSGFFFFGFDLKPGNLWNNHNYHDFPEGLAWAARIDRDFAAPGKHPVAPTPRNYAFPGGFAWWWWTTRYKAFYGYEQSLIPLSARLAGTPLAWYSSTNSLPEQFDAVIINCPNPPFSRYFAKEIARAVGSGQKVSYVGKRSDLGSIPELDKFFTDKTIPFTDGSSAQELRRLPGAKVLAEEKGRIWALRSGNLTIVSRTPDAEPKTGADEFLRYLSEIDR